MRELDEVVSEGVGTSDEIESGNAVTLAYSAVSCS